MAVPQAPNPKPALRVLLNAVNLDPTGGAERSLFEMAHGLAGRGYDLDLAYQRPGAQLRRYEQICDSVTRVRLMHPEQRRLGAAFTLAGSVLRAARLARRPDLVYVNDFWEIVYGACLSIRLRAPLVCHLRNEGPTGIENALALAGAARLVAVSEYVASRYRAAGVDERLIQVVHEGLDPNLYRPVSEEVRAHTRRRLGVADGSKAFLYAGRLVPEKGIEVLLDAFQRLQTSLPEARLVIAPCPPATGIAESEYARALRRLDGDWIWAPPAHDMAPYYGAADVVVVPSTWQEPFGRVALEAMACERPAVVSRVGGLPEVLGGDFESLLVEPGNPAALATKLAWAADWRQHSPELGERGRDRVCKRFTLTQALNGFEAALGAAIDEQSRRQERSRNVQFAERAQRTRLLLSSRRP